MVEHWINTRVQNSVKRQVLAEIVHPTGGPALVNKVLNDDLFVPVARCRVREVDHGELDTDTLDHVDFTLRILDKVAVV